MRRLASFVTIALLVFSAEAFARDGGTVVLVWKTATLYSAPSETAAHARIQYWMAKDRAHSTGQAWTMRERAALDGGWVEVETFKAENDESCSSPTRASAVGKIALRAFVHRA